MKRTKTTLTLVFALFGASVSRASPVQPSTTNDLMRQKLQTMHQLLEGLVLEDYTVIEKSASMLANISKASTWHKTDNEEFQLYAKSFQNSAIFLQEMARKKNLEGIAMGYIRVNLDCMQCHNFVRTGRKKN
jgi:cytochrome c556